MTEYGKHLETRETTKSLVVQNRYSRGAPNELLDLWIVPYTGYPQIHSRTSWIVYLVNVMSGVYWYGDFINISVIEKHLEALTSFFIFKFTYFDRIIYLGD